LPQREQQHDLRDLDFDFDFFFATFDFFFAIYFTSVTNNSYMKEL